MIQNQLFDVITRLEARIERARVKVFDFVPEFVWYIYIGQVATFNLCLEKKSILHFVF